MHEIKNLSSDTKKKSQITGTELLGFHLVRPMSEYLDPKIGLHRPSFLEKMRQSHDNFVGIFTFAKSQI